MYNMGTKKRNKIEEELANYKVNQSLFLSALIIVEGLKNNKDKELIYDYDRGAAQASNFISNIEEQIERTNDCFKNEFSIAFKKIEGLKYKYMLLK